MRKAVAVAAGLLMLGAVNWGIYGRERLLENGRVVLLELAPVDPRSLMQGDFMALRFRIGNEISSFSRAGDATDGRVVVRIGERGVGSFVRRDGGEPLLADEALLRYRVRDKSVKFATNAYFFQEGTGNLYALARYGEFRVAPDGDVLLTHLVSDTFERLGTGKRGG
jgi:uncharacterized membrane-anchored protein